MEVSKIYMRAFHVLCEAPPFLPDDGVISIEEFIEVTDNGTVLIGYNDLLSILSKAAQKVAMSELDRMVSEEENEIKLPKN